MSVVTSVILNWHPDDARLWFPDLQRRLIATIGPYDDLGDLVDNDTTLASTPSRWGGDVRPGAYVFGSAHNHLDLARFLQVVLIVPWKHPDTVQLFVREQDDDKLAVYEIVNGAWQVLG
jgi:hypothetical protein